MANGRAWTWMLALLVSGLSAEAATLSFAGNLRTDANVVSCGVGCTLGPGDSDGDFAQYAVVVRSFNVLTPSLMEAVTFSYGGGVNGAGTNVSEGGFAPYLSLFDSADGFLGSTYLGVTCPAGALTNTVSGACYDVALASVLLNPGTYRITISAYLNLSLAENLGAGTLADGFTGLGNLALGEDLHYAFDVILTSTTAVPEPGSLGLLAVGVGFAILKRRLD